MTGKWSDLSDIERARFVAHLRNNGVALDTPKDARHHYPPGGDA